MFCSRHVTFIVTIIIIHLLKLVIAILFQTNIWWHVCWPVLPLKLSHHSPHFNIPIFSVAIHLLYWYCGVC